MFLEKLINKLFGKPKIVYAHCDIPCGIYDPHQAQLAALTVIRMIDIIQENTKHLTETESQDSNALTFQQNINRAILVKEEHAEKCKHEIRIIWGDYFKDEHLNKYPELNNLVKKIMELGSKAKQTVDRKIAVELLETINRFAEIFWETKGIAVKRVKAPYPPKEEIVLPIID